MRLGVQLFKAYTDISVFDNYDIIVRYMMSVAPGSKNPMVSE